MAYDKQDHCEMCGISIPATKEDASYEERLCDTCLDDLEAAQAVDDFFAGYVQD